MSGMQPMLQFMKTDLFAGPAQRPQSLTGMDVRAGIIEDLALKILYLSSSLSVIELAEKMRLSFEVANELFFKMRAEQFCQVTGMAGNIPHIAITSNGRNRAMELLSHSHYAGVAPVSLESYVKQARSQGVQGVTVRPNDVERAFTHMVLD